MNNNIYNNNNNNNNIQQQWTIYTIDTNIIEHSKRTNDDVWT